jgi:hypothetical protein
MYTFIDKSGYPLPTGIEFCKEEKTLVLTLNRRALISNMQKDQSAFEGWALCVFANNPGLFKHIRIDWEPIVDFKNEGVLTSAERGHFYRFLYRAYMFSKNYPSLVEINPLVESIFDVSEFKNWVLNFPMKKPKDSSKKNKDAEAHLERELLAMMDGHFDYCDHQLPVGLFLNEVKDEYTRCSGKLSQIDLWSVKNNALNVYELKNDMNEAVGIISELMFYTNVMDCYRRHIFNYPAKFAKKRVFFRHSKELYDDITNNQIEMVNGYLLANYLHPRITNEVISLMNTNTSGIVYRKLTVNDFKSQLLK